MGDRRLQQCGSLSVLIISTEVLWPPQYAHLSVNITNFTRNILQLITNSSLGQASSVEGIGLMPAHLPEILVTERSPRGETRGQAGRCLKN